MDQLIEPSSRRSSHSTTSRRTYTLRVEVALGLGLPILLILSGLAIATYLRDRGHLEDQIAHHAEQLGEVALGGLHHAFLDHNPKLIGHILSDLGRMENIYQVRVIGLDGQVAFGDQREDIGVTLHLDSAGCEECHRYPAVVRPLSTQLDTSGGMPRVSMPVRRAPECQTCHGTGGDNLGVLLLDVSVLDIQQRLMGDLRNNLIFSGATALLVSAAAFLLTHALIVRRIETFQPALRRFAHGDFSARLPIQEGERDELGTLARTLNEMASDLERNLREREARAQVRQQAILEERDRIARDLHDGVGQLLGYVKTKALAARLMLGKGQIDSAEQFLRQLEEASRELFTDVREAIIGLRSAPLNGGGLPAALSSYADRFSHLTGMSVHIDATPDLDELSLPPEVELHFLRITQEALANTRKHAAAEEASIHLSWQPPLLKLMIKDNGRGFDPQALESTEVTQFGLTSMRERAREIGADFVLDSMPGKGTRVSVSLEIPEDPGP